MIDESISYLSIKSSNELRGKGFIEVKIIADGIQAGTTIQNKE